MNDISSPDTFGELSEPTFIDVDGDGVGDAYQVIDDETGLTALIFDTNDDGSLDTVLLDIDGDGEIDASAADTDGDGELDQFEENAPSETDTATALDANDEAAGESVEDGATVAIDSDAIHGDPMAEIPYHQAQAGNNDCLPTSVSMVLSEITGAEVPASEVVDLANERGLLSEAGMTMDEGLQLLDHWGVKGEVQTGSLDGLRTMLDAGTPVIIGLDSNDLYGAGDAPFADDLQAGHAVVITGIDDEAGLVYINDPGFPDGAGVAIPIDQFEDAWADAGHTMIVAEVPASADTVGSVTAETDTDLVSTIARVVLMPFNLKLN